MENNEPAIHFENERIRVSVEKKPGSVVRMEAHVNKEFVAQARHDAVRNIRREVSIPGFRKGKVPADMVQKHFSKQIEKEFEEVLKEEAVRAAIVLTNIMPFTKRSIQRAETITCSEEGASFLFVYEAWPVIPEVDIDALTTVPVEPKEISEEQVEEAYRQVRIQKTEWEVAEEGIAEKNDSVELDIDIIEAPAHNVCIGQTFYLDSSRTPQWIIDAVVGLQTNESKDTVSDESEQCRITLKKIKKAVPFEDGDALAKKMGFPTDQQLRDSIRTRLVNGEEVETEEVNRRHLIEELVTKYPIDLPERLFHAEVEARHHDVQRVIQQSALTEELKASIKLEAYRFLCSMLLLQPLAAKMKVKVLGHDLNLEMMRQSFEPPERRAVFVGMEQKNLEERLFALVMMRKTAFQIFNHKKKLAKA